jgi:predicted acylesterase/phospholipase RssA
MDSASQFMQVQPIRLLERRLVRECTARASLPSGHLELVRYALGLARLTLIRERGVDVDVFESVAAFRHWLVEQLSYFADPFGEQAIDWRGIESLVPEMVRRVAAVRSHIIETNANAFSVDRLEHEITRKELVLVLGGGGGSGYAHLGAFAVIAELGLTPGLIVGASMGAMLGLFRAQEKTYDPMATALALPRPSEFTTVFTPYRGYSRYGFPGSIELKARAVGREIFHKLIGREIPRIDELAIPYRAVGTGLRSGIGLALSDVEREIERARGTRSPVTLSRRVQLFRGVVRTMLANPRFLHEIVFGGDDGLENFSAIDAMGFSCAVPGIIHYDLFSENDASAEALGAYMSRHGLLRVTDGGVVSNVPARVAWNTVQRGEIGSRNAFILAFDAFAPVLNLNAIFYPIQQLVRRSVLLHRPYSDHLITYRQPPTPVSLLQSFDSLQAVIGRTRAQLRSERPFIEAMMRPIPRWGILENRLAP